MPGYLLHSGATVLCAHAGQAQPAAPNPRVQVSGQPVTVQPIPYLIAGCPFIVGTVPSPCLTAQWVSAATRVRANGQPVLLQDSPAICIPNATTLTIASTQMRVKGM